MADPSKKNYWVQLSAVNRQLERYDDSLAVLEIANMAGLLTTDSDLRPLTDLEAFVGIPFRAANNLDKFIAKGPLKADEKAYDASPSLDRSARLQEAVATLQKAGELHNNGDTFVRLAEVQLQRQEWAGAVRCAAEGARERRVKDTGNTQLLMGIALYSNKQPKEARNWFEKAATHDKQRTQAQAWIKHIDADTSS